MSRTSSPRPPAGADHALAMPDEGTLYELTYYPERLPDRPLLEFLTALVDPFARGGRVLDCSCGTGEPALWLAERYSVTLADASESMLRVAGEKARRWGTPGVTLRRAAWTDLPATFHESFDAVLCTGSALPRALTSAERRDALGAMRSVLRPGGLLYLDFREDFQELPEGRPALTEVAGPVEWQGRAFAVLIHETRTPPYVRRTKDVYLTAPGTAALRQTVASDYRPFTRDEILADLLATGFREPRFHDRPGIWPMTAVTAVREG